MIAKTDDLTSITVWYWDKLMINSLIEMIIFFVFQRGIIINDGRQLRGVVI